MKIWAHTLVRNEERFMWFAVSSVIDYVDRILLWDTGSSDNSLKIEKEIKKRWPDKIDLRQYGEVEAETFTKARQEMLNRSDCDWVMILDGDEVWWEESIKKAIDVIYKKGDSLDSLVHPYYELVGDIYHYQEESAGRYNVDGKIGNLTIRFFNRKIEGLHFANPHGTQGIYDKNNVLIQERDKKRRLHLDDYYLHFTHLIRSSGISKDREVVKRKIKYKYELGIPFPRDFKYPEVFYKERPSFVPDPWQKRSNYYILRAFFETPLRKLKRRFWFKRIGY